MKKSQNIMKMIVCKFFFCFLCLYLQLQLLKTVIFMPELTLSFLKNVLKQTWKFKLIPNFPLSERLGKAVAK